MIKSNANRISRKKATLRLFTGTESLERIVATLGVESMFGHSKGDVNVRTKRKNTHSLWTHESWPLLASDVDLSEHIKQILNFIRTNRTSYFHARQFCDGDVFCLITNPDGQAGFVLDREIIKQLNEFDLRLVIDIHSA